MQTVAEASHPRRRYTALVVFLRRAGVYSALIVVLVIAAFVAPRFYSPSNLANILRQGSALGILAVGETIVMLNCGIDLSVAPVMQLVTVAVAELTGGEDTYALPVIVLCLLIGCLVGCVNALIITRRGTPPFVATLGTGVVITGVRMVWTGATPSGSMPRLLRLIGHDSTGIFPNAAIVFLGIALVMAVLLNYTTFGRRLVASGANPEAARFSGVDVNRVTLYAYVLCGFLAAVAGLVLAGYVGYADQWIGRGYDLDSIAAAVVGGTTFAGGEGGIIGTVAGVLLVVTLLNLVVLLNLPVEYQMVVKGLVLILAVAFYSIWRRS